MGQLNNREAIVVRLIDNYDRKGGNVFELLNQNNSLQRMESIYQEISRDKDFEYIEVMNQPIEYIGKYQGSNSTVLGGANCKNQNVDGVLVTPLQSLQISDKIQKDIGIKELIASGKCWKNEDFFWDNVSDIKIIVGHNYKNSFNVGDRISAYYLGKTKVNFQVIGILKENSSINYLGEDVSIDNSILMPAINLKADCMENSMFAKILYLQKVECYARCNSMEQFEILKKQLLEINNRYDFNYNYVECRGEGDTPMMNYVRNGILFALFLFLFFYFFICILDYIPEVEGNRSV